MSPTCTLKTFHEYKALITFKFTNKDSIIRKTSWKFLMHYVNTTFEFLGNSILEKRKYLVIESSYFFIIAFEQNIQTKKFALCLKRLSDVKFLNNKIGSLGVHNS